MPSEVEELKDALIQFRIDVINALAEIDVEINALQQAVEVGQPVPRERLKQIRDESREVTLGKF